MSVEAGVGPVGGALDESVFDGVVVDVVDVATKIVRVADQVFPITALPQAAFATRQAISGAAFHRGQSAREAGLDPRPSDCIVGIAPWQPPQAM